MDRRDLLAGAGPAPTHLPTDPATELLQAGTDPAEVAARYPSSSAGWAALGERAVSQREGGGGHGYARTGYHRGLDQLRRAGWRGNGPVPGEQEPNQGFLRSLAVLAKAADTINEEEEAVRCQLFLADCSATAAAELL